MQIHILFIDDDDLRTFQLLRRYLTEEPLMIPSLSAMPIEFVFKWIRTSAEAIETIGKLPKNQSPILIVDYHFEGERINGVQLGSQLYALRPDLPFVFMSNLDSPEMAKNIQNLHPDMNFVVSQKTISKYTFIGQITPILSKKIERRTIVWSKRHYDLHDILCVTICWHESPPVANCVYLVKTDGSVTRYRDTLSSFSEALDFTMQANFSQVNRQIIVNRHYCEKHENPEEKRKFYLKDNIGRRTPIECSEGIPLPV